MRETCGLCQIGSGSPPDGSGSADSGTIAFKSDMNILDVNSPYQSRHVFAIFSCELL